jgi:hypothetical protein
MYELLYINDIREERGGQKGFFNKKNKIASNTSLSAAFFIHNFGVVKSSFFFYIIIIIIIIILLVIKVIKLNFKI